MVKTWDWVRYCGRMFRIVWIKAGIARISDGVDERTVALDVLEPWIEDEAVGREFHDPYPFE